MEAFAAKISLAERYDVIVVGGGISGASLLYVLARYTDINKILLLEKSDDLATLNSNSRNNSQTLHFGDIETNYSVKKALGTKEAAKMVVNYTRGLPEEERERLITKVPKMVLALGDEEVARLDEIYLHGKSEIFPTLKRIGKEGIAVVEPEVMRGRDPGEKVAAILSQDGYMVDFGALTKDFAEKARAAGERVTVKLDQDVHHIEETDGGFKIVTKSDTFTSSYVSIDAGSVSLFFAKALGYAEELILLLISGGFYYSPKVLNGKVYRVQKGHIPFAAVHGDPDVAAPDRTRFGPTAEVTALLEKGHPSSIIETMETDRLDFDTAASIERILGDRDVRGILERNALFHIPHFGKHYFLEHEVKKIVPSLKADDLEKARGIGGIRPQIVDKKKRELELGEVVIRGKNIIFNVTPSPGATACLQNARKDALYITDSLGMNFDSEAFASQVLGDSSLGHGQEVR